MGTLSQWNNEKLCCAPAVGGGTGSGEHPYQGDTAPGRLLTSGRMGHMWSCLLNCGSKTWGVVDQHRAAREAAGPRRSYVRPWTSRVTFGVVFWSERLNAGESDASQQNGRLQQSGFPQKTAEHGRGGARWVEENITSLTHCSVWVCVLHL